MDKHEHHVKIAFITVIGITIVMVLFSFAVIGVAAMFLVDRQDNHVRCDEVVVYDNGGKVCEIFLRKSVDSNEAQRQGITEGDRI